LPPEEMFHTKGKVYITNKCMPFLSVINAQ